jgi:O-antigen/teichoic acid export membrane protein
MVVPDALCTAAYPALVNECVRGRKHGTALMLKYLLIAGAGGTVVAICGTIAAGFVGRILFPGESALFATVARITIWALPLIAVEAVMGYALNAAGKEAEQARAALPAAAVNLVGSLALVATLGVIGASWAMLLRTVARSVFLLPLVLKTFRSGADSGSELADALGSPLLRKAG